MSLFLLLAATYVLTGAALTGYDFSAPPLHAKMYVIRRDHSAALRNWFAWPVGVAFELYQLSRMRQNPVRHAFGVLLLAGGMLGVLRLAYELFSRVLPWTPLHYLLALITGFVLSPILCALVMPKHGHSPR